MAWNHKSRVVAMAIAIQSAAGTFDAPTSSNLIAVSPPSQSEELISADDPTATGSVWENPRIYLGKTSTMSAVMPLRGPGGTAVPAANAWLPGNILQAAGFTEVRTTSAITGTAGASSTTTAVDISDAGFSASATDDFYVGMPIQHANIGTGLKANSGIVDYNGTSKLATIAETVGSAPTSGTATIPPNLLYQLSTLSTSPPILSVSIWRDKKRYDYRDCTVQSLTIDMPVANESSQTFPSIEFGLKGLLEAVADDTAPALPSTLLTSLAPFRNGKFTLDKVALGHQSTRFSLNLNVGAASNAAAAEGQDAYEIMSGSRTIEMDLNQMAVSDFNIETRVDGQTNVSMMSLWGAGEGNRFVFTCPNAVLDPMNNPGDRNGFVNLTGNALPADVDKSATLAIWWDA